MKLHMIDVSNEIKRLNKGMEANKEKSKIFSKEINKWGKINHKPLKILNLIKTRQV